MPDNIPLPPDANDDPFGDFIQHDLDLGGMPDEEADDWDDWEELDVDTEEALSPPSFRPFASPSRRAAAPPPVTLPPLTDPRWQRGVYTAAQKVVAYRQPNSDSAVAFVLPAHPQKPRAPLHYLPEVTPGWTAVHAASCTGFVLSRTIQFEPYRWWRERFDGLFLALLLVLIIVAWLTGEIEHQQTVDNLNATITAQQTLIVPQRATLAAISGGR